MLGEKLFGEKVFGEEVFGEKEFVEHDLHRAVGSIRRFCHLP
jgi:hypothetical protein